MFGIYLREFRWTLTLQQDVSMHEMRQSYTDRICGGYHLRGRLETCFGGRVKK